MAKRLIYGLTGTIGSGKSAAARIFEKLGASLIDADLLAREVVEPGSPGLQETIKFFGSEYLNPDGNLNRSKLGKLVFEDSKAKAKLEQILHPKIRQLFLTKLKDIQASSTNKTAPVIAVIPLLLHKKSSYPEIKKVILIYSPKELCLERISARDGLSRTDAELRIQSQIPAEQQRDMADIVIENNSTLKELEKKIGEIYPSLCSQS